MTLLAIGKGLVEPCSPFRQANFFGAAVQPDANNWNCAAQIVGAAPSFDFSTISRGQLGPVQLAVFNNIPAGHNFIVQTLWFKNSGNNLLLSLTYDIPDPATRGFGSWAWYYLYSFLPYGAPYIDENGPYHIDVYGGGVYQGTINFSVTGISFAGAQFQNLSGVFS